MINMVIEIRKEGKKEGGRGGGIKIRGSEKGGRMGRMEGGRERNKKGEELLGEGR